jgi:hypothetical protein
MACTVQSVCYAYRHDTRARLHAEYNANVQPPASATSDLPRPPLSVFQLPQGRLPLQNLFHRLLFVIAW